MSLSDDAYPCECTPTLNEHQKFCPARVTPAPPVKCKGTIMWEPINRMCIACGCYGQSCDRTRSAP